MVIPRLRNWMPKNRYRQCFVRRLGGGLERKMRTLEQSMHMFLDDREPTGMEGYRARSKNNMKLYCFLILMAYWCDIFESNEIGGNRHVLSVSSHTFNVLTQ